VDGGAARSAVESAIHIRTTVTSSRVRHNAAPSQCPPAHASITHRPLSPPRTPYAHSSAHAYAGCAWRVWVAQGPHALQSRVPSTFVSQSHHHARTTMPPQASVSMHTHPYCTDPSPHSRMPYAHSSAQAHAGHACRVWVRGHTRLGLCSREHRPHPYHGRIITRAPRSRPKPVSVHVLTHL
jgi:hypothetical protein